MLKTNNLTLRPPSQDIYESLRKVKPCDEFYRMVGNNPEDSFFANDEKFNKSFSDSLSRENYWHVFRGSDVIGVAFLHSVDSIDKRARYAVGIYNEENWNKGYGYEITQWILGYAFYTLCLHKVDLRVLEYNKRAISSYKNSGFIQDGILRDNAFIDNAWHNDIIMSILHHEFHDKHKLNK